MSWDAINSVNGTFAHDNSPRTFLMKSSFFTELKRRKVYKVAAAYAVVSWATDPGRIDFSAYVRCPLPGSSSRVSCAGFHCFGNSLVDF